VFKRKYDSLAQLKKKFRIVKTTIRGESFFTIEYSTPYFLIFREWKPIMVCEDLEDCERRINLIVALKQS
jgi:hypothetical protein